MPAEDRDRLFEKALERHLRRETAADLDAETLASYHDRLLPVDEMRAVESHVATCTRCQEILAQLELTRDLHESQYRDKVAVYEHVAAQSPAAPSAGKRESSGKIAHFTARKISRLRWAAPAGAIAAGILIWIGLRDFRSPSKVAGPAAQIAENRRDATPIPEAVAKQENEMVARQEYQQQGAKPSGMLRDEMRQRTAVAPESHAPAGNQLSSSEPKIARKGANGFGAGSGNRVGGGISTEKKENLDTSVAGDLDATKSDRKTLESETRIVTGGLPAAPPPPPPAPAPAAMRAKAASPAPASAPEASSGEATAQPVLQKDNNQSAQFSYTVSTLKLLSSTTATPDGKDIWRFGEHGGIIHSQDGGSTWKSQTAPLATTLTSGSAPSNKVCWIAGAAGALLRTTDGGKRWQIVITPIAADLGGVQASDDRHATIWDVGNHARYVTSDGGATWRQAARE